MPNVGRPSRDCHACRRRRTRCDLERPECRQCQRRGIPCPGYRDDLDILFHVQDVTSYQANMSRNRRRAGRREESNRPSLPRTVPDAALVIASIVDDPDLALSWRGALGHINASIQSAQAQQTYSPPWLSLPESWNEHLLPLTIYRFSFGIVNGQSQNLSDFISALLDRVDEGSSLFLAYKAVGCAYQAKQSGQDISASQPINAYNDALSAIQSTLTEPESRKNDSTVLAVWLLGLFELMLSTQNETTPRVAPYGWELHSEGLIALIRIRGAEQFARQDARDLFWVIFTTVQLQALIPTKNVRKTAWRG